MKKALALIGLLLCALHLSAKEYKVEDVPMVHLQNRLRYTVNPDNILSEQTVYAIDTTLYSLEQRTGIQVLVAALENIEGGDCFEFAFQLGQKNGIGQKDQNSGLVVLLVTGERCIQFATGYGLEGVLPDATCKQIQVRYMNSSFSKGNWDEGMLAGINAIAGILNGTDEFTPPSETNNGNMLLWLVIGAVFLFAIIVVIVAIVQERKSRKCPMCEHHTLQLQSTRTLSRSANVREEELTYVCTNCGYTKKKKRKRIDDNGLSSGGGAFLGGTIFGSRMGSGGGFSGGGFSGGSFGGGSFGGGGAGSKW